MTTAFDTVGELLSAFRQAQDHKDECDAALKRARESCDALESKIKAAMDEHGTEKISAGGVLGVARACRIGCHRPLIPWGSGMAAEQRFSLTPFHRPSVASKASLNRRYGGWVR